MCASCLLLFDSTNLSKRRNRTDLYPKTVTIWHYFLQILQALHHCHHPNSHRSESAINGGPIIVMEGGSRQAQLLHRDLKPSSYSPQPIVSLIIIIIQYSRDNMAKLVDFSLSKALAQASFANTYVGVRHCQGLIPAYTHLFLKDSILDVTYAREGVQYDSKSDIWSLGC